MVDLQLSLARYEMKQLTERRGTDPLPLGFDRRTLLLGSGGLTAILSNLKHNPGKSHGQPSGSVKNLHQRCKAVSQEDLANILLVLT